MKHLHWLTLVVGYLVGSFFGIASVLALFGSLFGGKKQAPKAA